VQTVDFLTAGILFVAGVLGGGLAGLVGGASLITFPAFLAAGLPPVIAVASNLAAVIPANLFAAIADRARMPPLNRGIVAMYAASVVAALIGAALLLLTPGRLFEILVPLLLGFATLLLACAPRVTRWLRERTRARGDREPQLGFSTIPAILPVSLYGGYFGAGVGVILLAVLSISTAGDYRSANVVKNIMTGLNTTGAAIYFAFNGAIAWPQTLVMMAGALAGGWLGGYLARIAPPSAMRIVVVAIGAILTAVYAVRYWL